VIGVIDYGVGNVQAFLTLYYRLGIQACRVQSPLDLDAVSRVVLPGVGHFDRAMHKLNSSGLRERLTERVLKEGVPLLGVCVGMQMLAASSTEGTPHMGWNDVEFVYGSDLWNRIEGSPPRFYFLHSYCFEATESAVVAARSDYGESIAAAVSSGNIHGVQFHPEKSHRWGERLLARFAGVDLDA
jgi:imidazole glycerol-phosphate synthase subunit HisH